MKEPRVKVFLNLNEIKEILTELTDEADYNNLIKDGSANTVKIIKKLKIKLEKAKMTLEGATIR